MDRDEIEFVAQALYDALESARGWGREPEVLKARFRAEARAAIAAFDERNEITAPGGSAPLVVTEELGQVRDFLLHSVQVSLLPVPGARAFRAILHGPQHTFIGANDAYLTLVGHRELAGRPVRDALPELRGQGYYELLDQVYRAKWPFTGRKMPFLVQPRPGAALEEHVVDFVYRPIEDTMGNAIGVLIDGYDRTEGARA
jgi:hypothetical protein